MKTLLTTKRTILFIGFTLVALLLAGCMHNQQLLEDNMEGTTDQQAQDDTADEMEDDQEEGEDADAADDMEDDQEEDSEDTDSNTGDDAQSQTGDDMEDDTADADSDTGDDEDELVADVVVNVEGSNFAFSETEIAVNEGDVVQIILESVEGYHDLVIDEFDAATQRVNAGGTTTVTFVADETGEFEYYCSVGSHREQGMVGTLTVN